MLLNKYLQKPKSIAELHEIIQESGEGWTQEQLELYLLLYHNAKMEPSGEWYILMDENADIVLDVLDKAMIGRKLLIIEKHVMPLLPPDLLITRAEIIEIARISGRYESPNDRTIRRKQTEGGIPYGADS
jgi:hypothetical protein